MDVSSFLVDSVRNGFTNGHNYDSNRPEYTDEVTDEVIRMLGVLPEADQTKKCTVAELGAGTGKFTKKIFNKIRMRDDVTFVATEPMAEFLTVLQKNNPTVQTLRCATENLLLPDISVQGILAAQCFHWFSNKKALDEIHRVLSDNGNLVLLWNFNDRNIDWINQIHTRIDQLRTDPCQYNGYKWKSAVDNHSGFQFVEQKIMRGTIIKGDVGVILNHCSTHSGLQKLEESQKAKELDEIRNILISHPDTKGSDCIELPFFTDIYQYRKVAIQ